MKCQQIRNIKLYNFNQIKQPLFKSKVLTKDTEQQTKYFPEECPKNLSTFATLNYLA